MKIELTTPRVLTRKYKQERVPLEVVAEKTGRSLGTERVCKLRLFGEDFGEIRLSEHGWIAVTLHSPEMMGLRVRINGNDCEVQEQPDAVWIESENV